jgi:hypothetical protein
LLNKTEKLVVKIVVVPTLGVVGIDEELIIDGHMPDGKVKKIELELPTIADEGGRTSLAPHTSALGLPVPTAFFI